MKQLAQKLQQFMVGRYGNDEFTLFLSIAGLILGLLANFKYLGFSRFSNGLNLIKLFL